MVDELQLLQEVFETEEAPGAHVWDEMNTRFSAAVTNELHNRDRSSSHVRLRRPWRRRIPVAAAIAASVTALSLFLSGTFPFAASSNAAAAQLKKIAQSVASQRGLHALLSGQFDYLEISQSAIDIGEKIHGKRIRATQSGTEQTWMRVLPNGLSSDCRFKQSAGPVKFIGTSETIWAGVGKPSIGAKGSDIRESGCGHFEQLGVGGSLPSVVTPTNLLAALRSNGHPSNSEVFIALVNIYFGVVPPSPQLRSAVLGAMAQLPDLVSLGARDDVLGRKGLGFSVSITRPPGCLGNCGRVHYVESIIVDPTTGDLFSMTSNQQGPSDVTTIDEHAVVNSSHGTKPSNN
jgi:hypothetical protein